MTARRDNDGLGKINTDSSVELVCNCGTEKTRYSVLIKGIVQGVGFRPFVYNSALLHFLQGWVANSHSGVLVEAEGRKADLEDFITDIRLKAPPLASVESIDVKELPAAGYNGFEIRESSGSGSERLEAMISPDAAICGDCLAEMYDPSDRRYLYPFINCTNCGPRFTISRGIPYDRCNTTMESFVMCERCRKEYENPADRRFHAQPISCPDCGPVLYLLDRNGRTLSLAKGYEDIVNAACEDRNSKETQKLLRMAADFLKQGKILAVKGLGGYHLACNALDREAVHLLRKRKFRDGKPFALMVKDSATAAKFCNINPLEKTLLESSKKPIVLLERNKDTEFRWLEDLSPDNIFLGVMLPYTPLHYLLFGSGLEALVMTSGNVSGEPIFYKDDEALSGLSDIADYFLVHNREIYIRTDDSVTGIFEGREYILRRSRGYVPQPIDLSCVSADSPVTSGVTKGSVILSCGGELKNTFCIVKDGKAFLSHHIGDLENMETLQAFESGIQHFKQILSAEPAVIAHDAHPEYLSTKYALKQIELQSIPVQHHHAHIAACMAENEIRGPVIGVAFDGTGFGLDGHIWGGEFFSGDYGSFFREAHLDYVPMPGGDASIREPWRMALSYICRHVAEGEGLISFLKEFHAFDGINENDIRLVKYQIDKKINCPLTSSIGRLFDAVSALLGLCTEISYEGQAAIRLEKAAVEDNSSIICDSSEIYGFSYESYSIGPKDENGSCIKIGAGKLINQLISDIVKEGKSKGLVSSKFHVSVAVMVADVCEEIRSKRKLNRVVLSGGVFQNRYLLSKTLEVLRNKQFEVYIHSRVPSNDGCIALGQAAIALRAGAGLNY